MNRTTTRLIKTTVAKMFFCLAATPLISVQADLDKSEDNADASSVLASQVIETSALIPAVGHQGTSLGARIEAVENSDDGKMVKIAISLPTTESDNSDDSDSPQLEEVIVYGTPEQQDRIELNQQQEFEVVNNLDEGRSGIIIYLDKQQDFVLRLNYTEPRPDVEPDLYNR
ncbi:MAG: hypothetical protein CL693_21845 [Cellvibrionaceae bacterium]|nr:hypothetical protein [Cellvibrionaceae bacterium]|tara:strand:- start:77 stop:589 length:513 start_codon:yes stop_codon:yes gene_type:complete